MVESANVQRLDAGTLLRLELWGDTDAFAQRFLAAFGAPLPGPGRGLDLDCGRILRTEISAWWIFLGPGNRERLEAVVADEGALTDISGAWSRIRIAGPNWREQLMISGVFDAENPAFAVNCTAGTLIDHIPVRLDVISDACVDVYVAASYARHLVGTWGVKA